MEEGVWAWVRKIVVVGTTVGLVVLGSSPVSLAKAKPKTPPSSSAQGGPPAGESVNACGCYHDAKGGCVCTDKKGKCECPGECEPVGCGEKRDKEMEREMAVEIKRAQDDEKKRLAAQEAQENGTVGAPDAGEAPPSPPVAAKSPKASHKDAGAKAAGNKPDKK